MQQRIDSLAQQVEHNTFNVGVLGSSPRRITQKKAILEKGNRFFHICTNGTCFSYALYFFRSFHKRVMSSRVLPFVSGTNFHTKIAAMMQIAP